MCPADVWISIQTKYTKLREKSVEALSSFATAHVIEIQFQYVRDKQKFPITHK